MFKLLISILFFRLTCITEIKSLATSSLVDGVCSLDDECLLKRYGLEVLPSTNKLVKEFSRRKVPAIPCKDSDNKATRII